MEPTGSLSIVSSSKNPLLGVLLFPPLMLTLSIFGKQFKLGLSHAIENQGRIVCQT